MSFLEKVAEAPNQREALLMIAGALDIILEAITSQPAADSWDGGWDNPETYGGSPVPLEPSKGLEHDGSVWIIPLAPKALQQARAGWAATYLPGLGAGVGDELAPANQGADLQELFDAYVKGGPEWLTAYDTEFVQTLPPDAKQAMALDYQERGLNQEALEFSVAFMQGDATSMATAVPLGDTMPGKPLS